MAKRTLPQSSVSSGASRALDRFNIHNRRNEADLNKISAGYGDAAEDLANLQNQFLVSRSDVNAKALNRQTDFVNSLNRGIHDLSERRARYGSDLGVAMRRAGSDVSLRDDLASRRGDLGLISQVSRYADDPTFSPRNIISTGNALAQRAAQHMVSSVESGNIARAGVYQGAQSRVLDSVALAQMVEAKRHREGTDESGALGSARTMMNRFSNNVEGARIGAGVAAGSFGNFQQMQKSYGDAGIKLSKAQQELTAAIEKRTAAELNHKDATQESAEAEKKRVALLSAEKGFKTTESILDEARKQGKHIGASTADKIASGAAAAMGMASGFSSLVEAKRYRDIGVHVERMNVETGLAQVVNQKYQAYQGMGAGDAISTGMILENVFGRAKGLGDNYGRRETKLAGQQVMATGAGGTAQLGADVANASNAINPGSAISTTTGNAGSNFKAVAMGLNNLQNNISAGQTSIATQQAFIAQQTAQNQIKWEQMGQYRDMRVNLGEGLRGIGGGLGGYSGAIASAVGARGQLAGMGVGSAEQAQIYHAATQVLGVGARGGGATAAAMGAGRWMSGGYLESTAQYGGMLGKMATTGGGTKELEAALRTAVAAGLDSSKNMEQMVSGITSVAASSASLGVNTADAAMRQIGLGTGALQSAGISKNLAIPVSTTAALTLNAMSGDTSMSLGNIVELAANQRAGMSARDARIASGTRLDKLQAIRAGGKAGREAATLAGLGDTFYGADGNAVRGKNGKLLIDEAIINSKIGIITNMSLTGLTPEETSQAIREIKVGKLTGKAKAGFEKSWLESTKTSGIAGQAAFSGDPGSVRQSAGDSQVTTETSIGRKVGAESENKQISAGETAIKASIHKTFEGYAKAIQTAMAGFNPTELQKNAKASAENFDKVTLGAGICADGLKKLAIAVGELEKKINDVINGNSSSKDVRQIPVRVRNKGSSGTLNDLGDYNGDPASAMT